MSRTVNYKDLPSDGYEKYEGKRVLIVGMGNAALETADALAPHVAYVHLVPGREKNSFRMAYETRYVGSPRTIRSQVLDAYLLKSLDGGFSQKGKILRRYHNHASAIALLVEVGEDM